MPITVTEADRRLRRRRAELGLTPTPEQSRSRVVLVLESPASRVCPPAMLAMSIAADLERGTLRPGVRVVASAAAGIACTIVDALLHALHRSEEENARLRAEVSQLRRREIR